MFYFKVVKKCKSSLERQVREAVRIQMRGNILNKKGIYNRWAPGDVGEMGEECIGESNKIKRK